MCAMKALLLLLVLVAPSAAQSITEALAVISENATLSAHLDAALGKDVLGRISLLQADFAFAVNYAIQQKRIIVWGNYTEVWDLPGCFDCVLRTGAEETLCRIFKKRMTDIEAAVSLVVSAAAENQAELWEFQESMLSTLRINRVKLYAMKNRKKNRKKPVSYEGYALVLFGLLYLWEFWDSHQRRYTNKSQQRGWK